MMLQDRDCNPEYLLGPFDSDRMVRLVGLPQQQVIQASIQRAQRTLGTFDRNLTYHLPSLSLLPATTAPDPVSGGTPVGANGRWAAESALNVPPFTVSRAGTVLEPFARTPAVLYSAEFFAGGQRHVATPSVSDLDPATLTPFHEHAHAVVNEMLLSDALLGTDLIGELEWHIDSVIPGFGAGHIDEFREQLRLAGVSEYGLESEVELICELAVNAFNTDVDTIPLAKRVMRFLRNEFSAMSPTRHDRQLRLLELAPSAFLAMTPSTAEAAEAAERFLPELGDRRLANVAWTMQYRLGRLTTAPQFEAIADHTDVLQPETTHTLQHMLDQDGRVFDTSPDTLSR